MEKMTRKLLEEGLQPMYSMGPEFGGYPLIGITDPEGFKQVFTNDTKFPKNVPVVDILGRGLVMINGEEWRQERKRWVLLNRNDF